MRRILLPLAAAWLTLPAPALADVVVPDDQIVQSSQCVGFDCVDGESFGFDTLRLKENNTRIKFDDTSVNPGFAANDWALQANEVGGGGAASRFMLMDDTAGRTPFTVFAAAPTDALVVNGSGVGVGVKDPAAALHVRRSDGSAVLRVEEAAGTAEGRVLAELVNRGPARLRFTNSAPDATAWLAGGDDATNFAIRPGGQQLAALTLTPRGEVVAGTVLKQSADPAAAAAPTPVDQDAILVALRTLPLSTTSYKADPDALRHLWPAAHDFHAAFGLGADDGTVAPGDVAGVALAAVKALDARVTAIGAGPAGPAGPPGAGGPAGRAASKTRIAKLERRNRKLSKRLRALERQVRRLAQG